MLKDEWCELIDRAEFARGSVTGLGFSKFSIGINLEDSTVLLCLKRGKGCQHIWMTEAEAREFLGGDSARIGRTFVALRKDMVDAEKSDEDRAKDRAAELDAERERARKLTDKLLYEIQKDAKVKTKRVNQKRKGGK